MGRPGGGKGSGGRDPPSLPPRSPAPRRPPWTVPRAWRAGARGGGAYPDGAGGAAEAAGGVLAVEAVGQRQPRRLGPPHRRVPPRRPGLRARAPPPSGGPPHLGRRPQIPKLSPPTKQTKPFGDMSGGGGVRLERLRVWRTQPGEVQPSPGPSSSSQAQASASLPPAPNPQTAGRRRQFGDLSGEHPQTILSGVHVVPRQNIGKLGGTLRPLRPGDDDVVLVGTDHPVRPPPTAENASSCARSRPFCLSVKFCQTVGTPF